MKVIIRINDNNRIFSITSGVVNESSLENSNQHLIDIDPNTKLNDFLGALYVNDSVQYDEEYDSFQTAINTPPAEPEVTEPPAE